MKAEHTPESQAYGEMRLLELLEKLGAKRLPVDNETTVDRGDEMVWKDFLIKLAREHDIHLDNDDLRWITTLIYHIPVNVRAQTFRQYIDVWARVMTECPDKIKANNTGRRAANTFLRELVNERNF